MGSNVNDLNQQHIGDDLIYDPPLQTQTGGTVSGGFRLAGRRPLDGGVCAQHGRGVMGCKSPVGVPTWIHDESMITTSRRQGQGREALSGGSRSANVRGDGQKLHRRPGLRASWHLMTKPIGCGGQGKCSAYARKYRVLTWGDLHRQRCESMTTNPRNLRDRPRFYSNSESDSGSTVARGRPGFPGVTRRPSAAITCRAKRSLPSA